MLSFDDVNAHQRCSPVLLEKTGNQRRQQLVGKTVQLIRNDFAGDVWISGGLQRPYRG